MIFSRTKINEEEWHDWFAWHPIIISRKSDGIIIKKFIWLQKVQRRIYVAYADLICEYKIGNDERYF